MKSRLEETRREVESLQRDEQSKLERQKQAALDKMQREVTSISILIIPCTYHVHKAIVDGMKSKSVGHYFDTSL